MASITVARARLALIPTAVALWPAWIRHVKFGLQSFAFGLVMFGLLCGWYAYEQRRISPGQQAASGFLVFSLLLLLVYVATFGRVPPLGSQIIATEIIACVMLASYPPALARRRLAYLALLPLTLPLETALQFVLGYPFRRLSAEAVGVLLSPYGVTIKGTTLLCNDIPLEVDAACSGVLGLWALLMIGAMMSLVDKHTWSRLLLTMIGATVASICYNTLRTSLLFMYRFHSGAESSTMHSLLGALAFVVTLIVFVSVIRKGFRFIPSARDICYKV